MTHEQLRHHAEVGGSIFDSIKSFGRKFLSAVQPIVHKVANAVRPIVHKVGNVGKELASEAWDQFKREAGPLAQNLANETHARVKTRIQRGITDFVNTAGARANSTVDRGLKRFGAGAMGTGLNRAGARRKKVQQGEGFFDDLIGGVSSVLGPVAQAVLPVAQQVGAQYLTKALRGGGIKKAKRRKAPRKQAGKGIFDDIGSVLGWNWKSRHSFCPAINAWNWRKRQRSKSQSSA